MAEYEDKALTDKVLGKLSKLPPLVQPAEVVRLKELLAEAADGTRFIIQGGDCAERFMDCEAVRLETQIKLLFQMGTISEYITGKPSIQIARIAGQYGKPRSKPTEVVEGHGEVMSYKGDNINGFEITDRKWDPERLLQGYFHSAATLNYLRSFAASSDKQDLSRVDIDVLKPSPEFERFTGVASAVQAEDKLATEFFTAHEALQLDLEEALTRQGPKDGKFYNLGAHFIWIGDRTRQLDGAHVEYFRGISNPIGCKVGPSMKADELKELVGILNPNKEQGRLVLITRYGASKVKEMLPGHIEAVKASGIPVVWQCDPVHGNVYTAKNKLKTRKYEDIISEVKQVMDIHRANGTVLGGIHLEFSGQKTITECVGGCIGITEEALPTNYETYCDPRLNYAQSLEAVFTVAGEISATQPPAKKSKTSD
jgi:3-deoxy-7-phosphoheptulonate synthase|eukprot:TRINITY_DN73585_c0_g1_i1.p1 TRINITY_DN73585_c0_g1~~TRINITY_DN73585_c0_g1_i1.p1  ORF type:complete len:462 (-),score=73.89 TRINITY_DN73585_c0_g1_i1:83-1360(-)